VLTAAALATQDGGTMVIGMAGYDGDPLEVSIELAREVVLGSVEYARSLGFDPHPDLPPRRGISVRGGRPGRHHLR
jgi:hypothetical protein